MRIIRGLAALLLLAAATVGIPLLLLRFGRLAALLDAGFPAVLLTPDDGTVLLGLLTVLGWALWALFALSVLAELLAVLTRQRVRVRLPGLARPQSLVAGLLLAVVTMVSIPLGAHAHGTDAPVSSEAGASTTTSQVLAESAEAGDVAESTPGKADQQQVLAESATADQPDPPHSRRHRVERGDDLWSLAERYYGDGLRWREIHRANASMISQPDQIDVGWNLLIPDAADDPPSEPTRPPESGVAVPGAGEDRPVSDAPTDGDTSAGVLMPTAPTELPEVALSPEPSVAARTDRGLEPAGESQAQATESGDRQHDGVDAQMVGALAGSVGAFLAAGVVGTLAVRRRMQLAVRPVGRRIPLPPRPALAVESALGSRQDPLGLELLDLAMRTIGRDCRAAGRQTPELDRVIVDQAMLTFHWVTDAGNSPAGFDGAGLEWQVPRDGLERLTEVSDLINQPCPWPTLVCLGHRNDGAAVMIELERHPYRLAGDVAAVTGSLNSLLVELCCAPWHAEVTITAVGLDEEFIAAIDLPQVRPASDLDAELDRLEGRGQSQRLALVEAGAEERNQPTGAALVRRLDPEVGPDWSPELLLVDDVLSATQQRRLAALIATSSTLALVTTEPVLGLATRELTLDGRSITLPDRTRLTPQAISESARAALTELMAISATDQTTPAPWWNHQAPAEPAPIPSGAVKNNVTPIHAARSAGLTEEPAIVEEQNDPEHPTVRLIGPVDLLDTRGERPTRAVNQCIEYCAWLLEHPGANAVVMRNSLIVAEGTRRSNTSRLRGWLGSDASGNPYLPDAYSGRITLHSGVSSDWQRLQLMVVGGVNRAGQAALVQALEMVRGAPLADAAPGQWHWAEELRIDMSSAIRDIGVALAGQALSENNIDLARWATARALTAAPEDELLLCARIRAEHQAGNRVETERLARRLTQHARLLGVDLNPETVNLLQWVMEGGTRPRTVNA